MDYQLKLINELIKLIPANAERVLEINPEGESLAEVYKKINPNSCFTAQNIPKKISPSQFGIDKQDHLAFDDKGVEDRSESIKYDAVILRESLTKIRNINNYLKVIEEITTDNAVSILSVKCIPESIINDKKITHDPSDIKSTLSADNHQLLTPHAILETLKRSGWSVIDVKIMEMISDDIEHRSSDFEFASIDLGITTNELLEKLKLSELIIRASKKIISDPLHIIALGIKKFAGVTDARIDYPLGLLSTLPNIKSTWGHGSVSIPKNFKPGIFILHRQFMNNSDLNNKIEFLIDQGWVMVADIDDYPYHWKEFIENDFYAFRSVHAVTVSTPPLAELIKKWNPNVGLFPNAIYELPEFNPSTPKNGTLIKIFIGALNRFEDWLEINKGIKDAINILQGRIHFVVVHDHEIYKDLPEIVSKEFHETLPHKSYMNLLADCDLALLPLRKSTFNDYKSDIKFIECCAAGTVPICSPVVYSNNSENNNIALFAHSPSDWFSAIMSLCENPNEIVRRKFVGLDYVKNYRMHSYLLTQRVNFYHGLIKNKSELEKQRLARIHSGI